MDMYVSADKLHTITNVPLSAYRVHAKRLSHISQAVYAIRRNNFHHLSKLLELDPTLHNKGHRQPIIFFAIKYRKPRCMEVIVNDKNFQPHAKVCVNIWLARYFHCDTFNVWRTSSFYKKIDLTRMLQFAIHANISGTNNCNSISAMLTLGASIDDKCGYPYTASELVSKFSPTCSYLFTT